MGRIVNMNSELLTKQDPHDMGDVRLWREWVLVNLFAKRHGFHFSSGML